MMIGFGVVFLAYAAAQMPPFPFGNATGDIFTGPNDVDQSARVTLPKPMAFFVNVSSVSQYTNGYMDLYLTNNSFGARVNVFNANIDTRNGGANQNQLWLRAGNDTNDLNLARDIIAGNGTLFAPQAVVVATWYKVEAYDRSAGPQNTFQVIVPYSETGETWAIFAFSQLHFFKSLNSNIASVDFFDVTGTIRQPIFTVNSNTTMNQLLNGTNCNRTGIYTHRINMGGPTKAPTKSPSKAPTKAPTKSPAKAPTKAPMKVPTAVPTRAKCGWLGWSIFCPRTLCGIFGRWVGFCQTS
jgi:hypothetical protein